MSTHLRQDSQETQHFKWASTQDFGTYRICAKASLNDHADVFIGVRDLMSKPSSRSIHCVCKKGRLQ